MPNIDHVAHASTGINEIDLFGLQLGSFTQNIEKTIANKIKNEGLIKTEDFEKTCKSRKNYNVFHSIFDYRPVSFQNIIMQIFQIKCPETLKLAQEKKGLTRQELSELHGGLLKMCIWQRVEPAQLMTISDAINALFCQYTEGYYNAIQTLFFIGHFIPQFVQLSIQTDPGIAGWRTSNEALVIYVMVGLSTLT